ncbi:Hypothetical protein, putative [Bodo saltans]|uniref:F-box domain-containing protein n=1 Tax=Bodo saltans TaxID=75058 RepID=A0A0S4JRP9_BODSA|nr:Hypothetical protein, putative [Bodo saltans]|eukprot:CUG92867.1 Hypothetical protein, putative [Bodo saltans]
MLTESSTSESPTLDSDNKPAAGHLNNKPRVFSLCPDTIVQICEFLEPVDLARVASTCHPLRSLLFVFDAVIWREQCINLWRDKQGFRRFCNHFVVHTSLLASDASRNVVVDASTMGGKEDCSTTRATSPHHCRHTAAAIKPKRMAPSRLVPSMTLSPETTLRCIRDSILPPLAAASMKSSPNGGMGSQQPFALPPPATALGERRLWWELAPQEQVRRLRRIMMASNTAGSSSSSDDNESTTHSSQGHVSWKFAYFSSVRDSKRTRLAKSDLLAGEWTISFAQIPGRTFPVTFREDGTLMTSLHQDGLRYQLSQQGEELNVHVFPALSVTRVESQQQQQRRIDASVITDDGQLAAVDTVSSVEVFGSSSARTTAAVRTSWGWSIKNHFVCIESKDVPTPEYLNQLHLLCCPRPP